MAQISYGTITITDTNDIERIYVVYAKSSTNIDAPTYAASNWSETIANAPGSGDYVWQRTVIEQSGTHALSYGNPVCVTGPEGSVGPQGVGISSISVQYGTSANTSTQPTNWYNVAPSYDADKPIYWTKTINNFSNGTSSSPIIRVDQMATDAIAQSVQANQNAQNASTQATAAQQQVTQLNSLLGGHFMYGGALGTQTPVGARVVERIQDGNTDVSETPSKWLHNVNIGANGIDLRYNEAVMMRLAANQGNNTALKIYKPPTINGTTTVQGALAMELNDSALKFYSPNSSEISMMDLDSSGITFKNISGGLLGTFGSTGLSMSGDLDIRGGGRIGQATNNYWKFGDNKSYDSADSAYLMGFGTASIQLGENGHWRLDKNRIHAGWYQLDDNTRGLLHFDTAQDTVNGVTGTYYWDYGLNYPNRSGSGNNKFAYIRRSTDTTSTNLSTIKGRIDDDTFWVYKFWIDGEGKVHAPGFYIGDSNTPIGGGAGTVAEKLVNGAGSSTQPVYFRTDSGHVGELSAVSWDVNDSINASSATSDSNVATIGAIKTYVTGRGYVTSSGVTSITLTQSSPITITNSGTAVTSTGTRTIGLADAYGDTKNPYASKTKNYVLAAPATANGVPTFRALVAADIPDLSETYLTSYTETDPTVPSWAKASSKPSYSLSEITGTDDLQAIEALSDTSGFLKKTAANTWSLDTNTYLTSSSTLNAAKLSGAIPSAVTATTQASSDNSTKIATTAYVTTAIANLPEPMIFKGTVGTNGTITSLPAAAAANEGYTYKVITALSTPVTAKVGDTVISNGTAWTVIPSGDEPAGTVTNIATGSGLTGGPITSTGTISHADTSTQSNISASSRTYITAVTLDDFGHVTGLSTDTETVTDTHYTANLITGASASAKANAAASTNVYLNLVENNTVRNSHQIVGSGTVSVASDANGKITITGSAHPSAASSVTAVGTSAVTGTSTNYARQDHIHNISLATGDSNGQVKIAGSNVSVKGLGSWAYKSSATASDVGLGNVVNYVQVTKIGQGDNGTLRVWTGTNPSSTSSSDYTDIPITITAYEQSTVSAAEQATNDADGNDIRETYGHSISISGHTISLKDKNGNTLGNTITVPDNNTTYTFTGGTNKFTVTPSGGTAQDVAITISITNNVTGSGTSGYIAKWNGTNSITNGPAFSSTGTGYLKQDGTWGTPGGTYSLPLAADGTRGGVQIGYSESGTNYDYAVKLSSEKMYVTVPWTDTKVTLAAVTSGTTYYPVVGSGTGTATRQIDTTGFIYKGTNGTTSAVGSAILTLGNSTASGSAGNKQGQLILYGTNTKKATITLAAPSADVALALPTSGGTLALVNSTTSSSTTGISIANHGTTSIGSASNWNAGSASTWTFEEKSIPNVTSAGSASTWEFEEKSIPNVTSAGSASSWTFENISCDDITSWSAGSGSASISGAIDSNDTAQLNITISHTHTAPSLSYTARTVSSKSGGGNGTAPTIGTAIKVQSKKSGSNGTAPTIGTAIKVQSKSGGGNGTAPSLTVTSTTVVTGTSHTITDNGHTHKNG